MLETLKIDHRFIFSLNCFMKISYENCAITKTNFQGRGIFRVGRVTPIQFLFGLTHKFVSGIPNFFERNYWYFMHMVTFLSLFTGSTAFSPFSKALPSGWSVTSIWKSMVLSTEPQSIAPSPSPTQGFGHYIKESGQNIGLAWQFSHFSPSPM